MKSLSCVHEFMHVLWCCSLVGAFWNPFVEVFEAVILHYEHVTVVIELNSSSRNFRYSRYIFMFSSWSNGVMVRSGWWLYSSHKSSCIVDAFISGRSSCLSLGELIDEPTDKIPCFINSPKRLVDEVWIVLIFRFCFLRILVSLMDNGEISSKLVNDVHGR